jgi:uncharacterized surface protein with fasciclin (FAS1) repeats
MKSSTWIWVLGAALVIVVILGLWWHSQSASIDATQAGTNASTDNSSTTGSVNTQARVGSVVAVIDSIPDASRFAQELGSTGVASQLTGKGPYTVFVPINEAYGHLAPGTISNMSGSQLKRMVQYHVIVGKAIDVNVQAAGTVTAMSRDLLNFSVRQGDKSARVNSSVALQSFKASNGIVYLVDNVLLPPVATQ